MAGCDIENSTIRYRKVDMCKKSRCNWIYTNPQKNACLYWLILMKNYVILVLLSKIPTAKSNICFLSLFSCPGVVTKRCTVPQVCVLVRWIHEEPGLHRTSTQKDTFQTNSWYMYFLIRLAKIGLWAQIQFTTEMNKNLMFMGYLCTRQEKLMSVLCEGLEAIRYDVWFQHSWTVIRHFKVFLPARADLKGMTEQSKCTGKCSLL